jgi:hypothetical protein
MKIDDEKALVNRYRASVQDIQSPNLDRALKAAAIRQAARARISRRVGGSFLILTVASIALGTVWHVYRSSLHRNALAITDYGKIEGISTSYLLQVGAQRYSGPGTLEGAT